MDLPEGADLHEDEGEGERCRDLRLRTAVGACVRIWHVGYET